MVPATRFHMTWQEGGAVLVALLYPSVSGHRPIQYAYMEGFLFDHSHTVAK
jgi:hypothetical protein